MNLNLTIGKLRITFTISWVKPAEDSQVAVTNINGRATRTLARRRQVRAGFAGKVDD